MQPPTLGSVRSPRDESKEYTQKWKMERVQARVARLLEATHLVPSLHLQKVMETDIDRRKKTKCSKIADFQREISIVAKRYDCDEKECSRVVPDGFEPVEKQPRIDDIDNSTPTLEEIKFAVAKTTNTIPVDRKAAPDELSAENEAETRGTKSSFVNRSDAFDKQLNTDQIRRVQLPISGTGSVAGATPQSSNKKTKRASNIHQTKQAKISATNEQKDDDVALRKKSTPEFDRQLRCDLSPLDMQKKVQNEAENGDRELQKSSNRNSKEVLSIDGAEMGSRRTETTCDMHRSGSTASDESVTKLHLQGNSTNSSKFDDLCTETGGNTCEAKKKTPNHFRSIELRNFLQHLTNSTHDKSQENNISYDAARKHITSKLRMAATYCGKEFKRGANQGKWLVRGMKKKMYHQKEATLVVSNEESFNYEEDDAVDKRALVQANKAAIKASLQIGADNDIVTATDVYIRKYASALGYLAATTDDDDLSQRHHADGDGGASPSIHTCSRGIADHSSVQIHLDNSHISTQHSASHQHFMGAFPSLTNYSAMQDSMDTTHGFKSFSAVSNCFSETNSIRAEYVDGIYLGHTSYVYSDRSATDSMDFSDHSMDQHSVGSDLVRIISNTSSLEGSGLNEEVFEFDLKTKAPSNSMISILEYNSIDEEIESKRLEHSVGQNYIYGLPSFAKGSILQEVGDSSKSAYFYEAIDLLKKSVSPIFVSNEAGEEKTNQVENDLEPMKDITRLPRVRRRQADSGGAPKE